MNRVRPSLKNVFRGIMVPSGRVSASKFCLLSTGTEGYSLKDSFKTLGLVLKREPFNMSQLQNQV